MNLGTKNRGGKHQFDKTKPSIFKNIGAIRVIRGSPSSICENPCSSVANKQKSHAQKIAWLTSLPSAELPASGSRGSSKTSQPYGSPALCFRVRPARAKSIIGGAAVSAVALQRLQATRLPLENEDIDFVNWTRVALRRFFTDA